MLEIFIDDIKMLYNRILSGEELSLGEFKNKWKVETSIGEVYQGLCKRELKKELGSFYTPEVVVDFMVEEALKGIDLRENPYIKILDPSCGGGYFLTAAYDYLIKLYEQQGYTDMEEHILRHNLFGCDIDENAVMITALEFYDSTGRIFENIRLKDFLLDNGDKYNIIIGNPPYMGHKVLGGEYRERLYQLYGDVFKDKADLSYCFIKKSIENLCPGGLLSFFTSRYLLEALNGKDLRNYILQQGSIGSIVDFYGVRVVKGAGVDNIIINFIKGGHSEKIDFFRLKPEAKGEGSRVFEDIKSKNQAFAGYFSVDKESLKPAGWSFLSRTEESVLERIRGMELGVICEGFQGIITGCDGAFVLSRQEAEALELERSLLKPWIKSSNISAFSVKGSEELIIYSDLIEDEEKYSRAIEHIGKFRERLQSRRECLKGMRKWYQLQWGRRPELFEESKIIYPYKSSKNRFALDSGNYFSADVYGMRIRDMFSSQYTSSYLAALLNSSIYEFYIKSMAKKLGDDLYEYYPNKIMTLRIPEYIPEVEEEAKIGGEDVRIRIDRILVEYLGLTEEEYGAVLRWVK